MCNSDVKSNNEETVGLELARILLGEHGLCELLVGEQEQCGDGKGEDERVVEGEVDEATRLSTGCFEDYLVITILEYVENGNPGHWKPRKCS